MSPPRKKRDTSAADDSATDDATVDESTLRDKLLSVPSHIVEKALLLYALLTASDTPAWVRALVLAALAYLINPLDAVPDVLPGIGLTDDFAVLALALERASHYITPAVRKRARALAPKWLGK
jgi:uncharacterized membrane protein YkvA (DUF1232 family)